MLVSLGSIAATEPAQDGTAANNAIAQYNLGKTFEADTSKTERYQMAAEWYKKAAQQNIAEAQTRLGIFYRDGLGVKKDINEAILWLGKAALQNNADAQFALGSLYLEGQGVPKNDALAIGWLRKAAAQYHPAALVQLANAYYQGKITTQNSFVAYALYNQVAGSDATLKADAQQRQQALAEYFNVNQLNTAKALSSELAKPETFIQTLDNFLKKSQ
jgi:TPR repeat protein